MEMSITMDVGAIIDGDNESLIETSTTAGKLMMEIWQHRYGPGHFTHAGASKYGYVVRQGMRGSGDKWWGSYSQKKLKQKGHTYPLVFSGQARNHLRTSRASAAIDGNGTVTARLPVHFHLQVFSANSVKRAKSRTKWLAKGPKPLLTEISTVTSDEVADLERSGTIEWVNQLAHINRARRRVYQI